MCHPRSSTTSARPPHPRHTHKHKHMYQSPDDCGFHCWEFSLLRRLLCFGFLFHVSSGVSLKDSLERDQKNLRGECLLNGRKECCLMREGTVQNGTAHATGKQRWPAIGWNEKEEESRERGVSGGQRWKGHFLLFLQNLQSNHRNKKVNHPSFCPLANQWPESK